MKKEIIQILLIINIIIVILLFPLLTGSSLKCISETNTFGSWMLFSAGINLLIGIIITILHLIKKQNNKTYLASGIINLILFLGMLEEYLKISEQCKGFPFFVLILTISILYIIYYKVKK